MDRYRLEYVPSSSLFVRALPTDSVLTAVPFAVAGLNSTTQTFSATTGNSASIERLAFDGLLGMGYQSISNLGAMPWVQNVRFSAIVTRIRQHTDVVVVQIFSQGKIAAAVFSFKLAAASAASELYIGGINNALIVAGSTSWFPVTFRSYWVIDGAINGGITGQTQTNSIVAFNAIIDTGTTLIIAPTADANAFYAKIGGTAINDGSGFYTFPFVVSLSLLFVRADVSAITGVRSGTRCRSRTVGRLSNSLSSHPDSISVKLNLDRVFVSELSSPVPRLFLRQSRLSSTPLPR